MTFYLKADITLPYVLSDNMMLQQSADVRIWGWADAGEVWLCSGQSNMAMPMNGYSNGQHIEGGPEDIANSANKSIRLFRVASNPHPEFDDIGGCWTECTPQTVAEFSAAGYYFAREVNARTNLPVGQRLAYIALAMITGKMLNFPVRCTKAIFWRVIRFV